MTTVSPRRRSSRAELRTAVLARVLSLAVFALPSATRAQSLRGAFAPAEADEPGAARTRTSAMLHAATPDVSEIPAGEFLMGSTSGDLDRARNICARDRGSTRRIATLACVGYPRPSPTGADADTAPLCRATDLFEAELGAHRVRLGAYAIDRTEVTVARYAQCVRAGACRVALVTRGMPQLGADRQPIAGLSWDDARAFCTWAGGRLPTEAEWERAARGTDSRPFPWGFYFDPARANGGALDPSHEAPGGFGAGCTDGRDGYALTAPVGSFLSGISPHGVLDMAGNVAEWVEDLWDDTASLYPRTEGALRVMPRGPLRGAEHVVRGGSYALPAYALRTTYRGHAAASTRSLSIGVRCAYDRRAW